MRTAFAPILTGGLRSCYAATMSRMSQRALQSACAGDSCSSLDAPVLVC